ncbi:beta-L-arabinofuranosidase domain-containing protein [Hamadaea sp.]|uniref:glycoside hydrolase family 127 protein n=1 Tax=Hamadaea sp. TaxID=2024425 RepID=UPI0025BD2760|nr:beta-L-arabinofuranosidase domain-containing protein [Hamadaea sp.]
MIAAPTTGVTLHPLGLADSRITGGFWADRIAANSAAIPVGRERLIEAGNIGNLRIAAGEQTGAARGAVFWDSDVYKWMEAAAWEYARSEDPGLLSHLRELTATVAAAQESDGYLNSVMRLRGEPRYTQLWLSHELYNAGHLFQAAVAAARATGDRTLLYVGVRFADHLADTFGPGKRNELEGHPGIETALVELFRETGERRYLDLAAYFVDARGHGRATKPGFDPSHFADPAHYADRVPIREASRLEGHAVRAVYFALGATDVAIESGDAELLAAVRRLFDAMSARRQHVTGGVGSRWDGEAFGDDYELPPDRAYAETCAAIGVFQWAWRLLLATGDPRYADQMERILYNAVLPAVSLTEPEYFYVNTLHRRTGARADVQRSPANGRRPWFNCACCPPNVMRTLASLPGYVATGTEDSLQIHQYAQGTLRSGDFAVDVDTAYPWDGRVVVTVLEAPTHPVDLAFRIPHGGEYSRTSRVFRPGDQVVLELDLTPRLIEPDERVDATRGCLAVARGPLVYALEQPEHPDAVLEDLRIDPAAPISAEPRPDLLGGVTVLRSDHLTLIPYYAWANRGPHAMRIWIPTLEKHR